MLKKALTAGIALPLALKLVDFNIPKVGATPSANPRAEGQDHTSYIDAQIVDTQSATEPELRVEDLSGNFADLTRKNEAAPDYTIWTDGSTYYAKEGTHGTVTSNANAYTIIQNAIDALTGRGRIVLKAGTYSLPTGLSIAYDGITLEGEGDITVLAPTADIHVISANGKSNVGIKNLKITAQPSGTTHNHINVYGNSSKILVSNVHSVGSKKCGISLYDTTNSRVEYCEVEASNNHAIIVANNSSNTQVIGNYTHDMIGLRTEGVMITNYTNGVTLKKVTVANNIIENGQDNGVYVNQAVVGAIVREVSVINNFVSGMTESGGAGIQLNVGCFCVVQGNILQGNWVGITVIDYNNINAGSNYNIISGNNVVDSIHDGIYLNIANSNTVKNNSIYCSAVTTQLYGIYLYATSDNIVSSNRITNSGGYAILVDAASNRNLIQDNFTEGSTTGSIIVNNSNCNQTRITDNNFKEGVISNAGTNTRAWLNYNPLTDVMIADINPPEIATPNTNLSITGTPIIGTAGENVAFGNVCCLKSDGKYWNADANSVTAMPGVTIAAATINANATGKFVLPSAFMRNDSWSWTVGRALFISDSTPGLLTQTAPSSSGDQVLSVGYAQSATVIRFEPGFVRILQVQRQ
jgi:parallel beta-helix repeat protein